MACVGYHASHEQFAPSRLLALVRQAETAGFDTAMCSDHFHPWSRAQGHSGYAWSWLGAAMAVTRLPFGVVTSPVGRYHPAVVAQKAATLAEMHRGRFWMAVGSGEALNEAITGEPWPGKPQRNQRLLEAVEVMRALWAGEEVDHDGSFAVRNAKLYTRPSEPPRLLVAALSEDTARWGAAWADGLITVNQQPDRLRALVSAFREGGGDGKPMYLQVKLSYAADDAQALRGAYEQWRTNVLGAEASEELRTPQQFEAEALRVSAAQVADSVRVSCDPQRHVAWLQQDLALGFEQLYLHNVNQDQSRFIDVFGSAVLPALR
ncbi:putative non-F420 flavinoid oxidoreductase [Luteimonas cucumeris]|uniref:Putative non-F420 flavinoid oxidoreductase n=2 Tax=Luteimonas cucumeris TaxID=985012 RepID=A0A562L2P0_9GAMM|nr:putative non-F420 flavinoid oxidoreductase [Luteimonas cucumeris]